MSDRPQFQPSTKPSPGTMLRSAFFALAPADQRRALAEGWRILDDPPGSAKAPTITKAQFDRMPPEGQRMYLSRGGAVAD